MRLQDGLSGRVLGVASAYISVGRLSQYESPYMTVPLVRDWLLGCAVSACISDKMARATPLNVPFWDIAA